MTRLFLPINETSYRLGLDELKIVVVVFGPLDTSKYQASAPSYVQLTYYNLDTVHPSLQVALTLIIYDSYLSQALLSLAHFDLSFD